MLKKLFIFILFSFVFKITFAQEKCFVMLENKTDFPTNLIVAMTTSIISQFVKKVDQVPLSGIDKKNDKCRNCGKEFRDPEDLRKHKKKCR